MDSRKLLLIEMKKAAGLATPAEIAVYENAPVVTGNGLVTFHAADIVAWLRRWDGATLAPNALTAEPGPGHDPS